MDVAGGPAFARVQTADAPLSTTDAALGFTGDVAVGLTDWAAVGVRGDLMWTELDRQPVGATYGTARLGTRPGIVAGTVMLILFAVTSATYDGG